VGEIKSRAGQEEAILYIGHGEYIACSVTEAWLLFSILSITIWFLRFTLTFIAILRTYFERSSTGVWGHYCGNGLIAINRQNGK